MGMKRQRHRPLGVPSASGTGTISGGDRDTRASNANVTALDRWLLRRIAASTVPWFYLAFRTVGDEGGIFWERLSDSDTPGIREIDLLRWIHLGTPFRQTRQVKVHVRNYRVHVSEFKRDG